MIQDRCKKGWTTDRPRFAEADELVYLRTRYDAPAGGGVNPFGPTSQYTDGMNRYEYVKNNPVNRTDPSGLKTKKSECDKWRETPKPKDLCRTTDLIAQCMKCCAETFSKKILGRSWPHTWPGWFAWYGTCRNTCASSEGKLGPSLPGPGKTIPQEPRLEKEQKEEL